MKIAIYKYGWIPLLLLLFACGQTQKEQKKQENLTKSTQNQPILISDKGNKASCVYLTKDEKDTPVMSWVEIDSSKIKHFYFAEYDTVTQRFSSKKSIPIEQNASIHEEGMPKIAIKGDGSLFALYETSIPIEGSKWGLGDLRYVQSFDNGKTWTAPQSVAPSDVVAKQSGGFSNLGRLADGEIGIAWLGTTAPEDAEKYKGRPIKFAKTQGKKMEDPILVDPEGCECCRTAIGSTTDGDVFLAYRNLLPGSFRDISYSVSTDNGETFKTPNEFSQDHWKLDGCPHNGPGIQTIGENAYVVWFTDGENNQGVNLAEVDEKGNTLAVYNLSREGRFIQVAQTSNENPVVAFTENYQDQDSYFTRIVLNKLVDGEIVGEEITENHVNAGFPVIVGIQNQQVIVAWSQGDQVYYKRVDTDKLNPMWEETPDLIGMR